METVKLQCTGCGRIWHGPADKAGTRHTECKAESGKGNWERVLQERATAKPTNSRTFTQAKKTSVNKTTQRLPNGPTSMERYVGEVKKANHFIPNWHSLIWNRMGIKGYAVAAVEGYHDVFVQMVPHYSERLLEVIEERLRDEVKEGVAFIADPVGVIELVLHQLSRHPEGTIPTELVEHLLAAQQLLNTVKEGFTPPAMWTTHTEIVGDSPEFFGGTNGTNP